MHLTRSTLEGWLAWRGRRAVDAAGEPLGTIADIYLDQRLHQPTWALLDLGSRSAFAPLQGAAPAGDALRLAIDAATVRRAPTAPAGRELSAPMESMLRRHYEELAPRSVWEAPRPPAGQAAPAPPTVVHPGSDPQPRDPASPDPASPGPANPGGPSAVAPGWRRARRPSGAAISAAVGIAAVLSLTIGTLLTRGGPADDRTPPGRTVAPERADRPARRAGEAGPTIWGGTFEAGFDGWAATAGDVLDRTTKGRDGWGLIARDAEASAGRHRGAGPGAVGMVRHDVLRDAARGTRVRMTAWVRVTKPGAEVRLRLVELRGGRQVAVDAKVTTVTDREWRHLGVSGVLEAGASDLDLQVLASGVGGGALLMDSVSLEVSPPS